MTHTAVTPEQMLPGAEPEQTRELRTWEEPEVKRYWGILRRRIWAVIAAFVIVLTLGTVHAFKATPTYRADARILIEKNTPRVMNFEDVVQFQASDLDYYKTQQELVKSRPVLEKAIEKPGVREALEGPSGAGAGSGVASLLAEARRTVVAVLGTRPTRPPELWERLRDVVEVSQLRDTHLLEVSVEDADPDHAATTANAVAAAFEEYHLTRKLETSDDAFQFLREHGARQEQKLLESEDKLQEFREKVRVVSLDSASGESPVLVRLNRLNSQLTEAQLQRIELEAQFHVVEQALESDQQGIDTDKARLFSLPVVRDDESLMKLRASLMAAEQELAALADTYGPDHPQLEVASVRADMLREELVQALGQVVGSVSAQLEMLSERERALEAQYDAQNQLALDMAKQSLTYNRLQNEVSRQQKLFEVLVERMREVDLSGDYAKTNVAVVETADVPRVPVAPKKARVVLLSALLGLLLGVGLAFFFEHMDDTVRTPEDMEERVGISVLGFVPAMDSHNGASDEFSYRGMVCALDPASSATEAYRSIRTSLFFSAPAEKSTTLVVTSSGPRDGKTTTATNLALVMAQSGKRVLLVDADFRRPMVHKVFGLDGGKGATNVLVGQATLEQAVQRVHNNGDLIENLDVLVAGPKPPNPAELLDSQSMRQLLAEARLRYDRVVVDTPPVLFVADASIVSAISDGVVMVVKSAANSRSLARRAREQLEGVNARILGGILNDVHVSRLGYYYSDYYHYGYSRYYKNYYDSYYSGASRKG